MICKRSTSGSRNTGKSTLLSAAIAQLLQGLVRLAGVAVAVQLLLHRSRQVLPRLLKRRSKRLWRLPDRPQQRRQWRPKKRRNPHLRLSRVQQLSGQLKSNGQQLYGQLRPNGGTLNK